MLLLLLRGIAMGIADAIPGVSGGTIAFISGIYERLVSNLRDLTSALPKALLKGQWRAAWGALHLSFFLPLLAGAALALVGMSRLLTLIFGSEVLRTALLALFCGLVAASALFCVKRVTGWSRSRWVALIGGGIGVFLLIGAFQGGAPRGPLYEVQLPREIAKEELLRGVNYQPIGHLLLGVTEPQLAAMVAVGKVEGDALVYHTGEERWFEARQVVGETPFAWAQPGCLLIGAVAGCAMLLPGVSGAFVLHVAGAYEGALMAVAAFSEGDWSGVPLLLNLSVGVLLGVALFARLVHWLFRRFPDVTTALLTGVMVGALRSLWPFWSYQRVVDPIRLELLLEPVAPVIPDLHRPLFWGILLVAFQGALLLVLIEAVAHRISCRKSDPESA